MTFDIHCTATTPFGTHGAISEPFYTVRAGIPLEDALSQISLLLKCAGESPYERCDCELQERGLLWSALHQIEAAKALTDALIGGVSVN
ncbi:hypothetical protein PMM47T1_07976 [Pseudomonas sp. M47T1]|uniref:DUF3077 domain-containing protein n=1 Tax=Pseudomonas sp. M47T1 TaxID=1179778 RepID=UPI000260723E|nr:DUF3077 domain-containing protein [Pseudomonas sp. M47T1]EIK97063.1 hypothetical protein PMM47T1_07976 [Pseudomonas sp. M47T1]